MPMGAAGTRVRVMFRRVTMRPRAITPRRATTAIIGTTTIGTTTITAAADAALKKEGFGPPFFMCPFAGIEWRVPDACYGQSEHLFIEAVVHIACLAKIFPDG